MTSDELLPLPEPERVAKGDRFDTYAYTADQMRAYALANLQSAKPADALGSLPVVAYTDKSWLASPSGQFVTKPHRSFPMALTDHAQATAEIAKRDAEILRLDEEISVLADDVEREVYIGNEYLKERATLRAKLAGVDGLVEALRWVCKVFPTDTDMAEAGWSEGETENACKAYDNAKAALATYEAAQGKTPPPEQA